MNLTNLMNRMDDEHSLVFMETKILNPNSSYFTFGKEETTNNNFINNNINNINDHIVSDEDEPGFDRPKGRKGNSASSPWQRMKWSDSRVRLLIQVVACVGDDEGTVEGGLGSSRKCIHKKGKWKTVSKIMVSKGCQVSPQQCEDKFNDLNKRYKRLNDILGRGVTCRVVENPGLMETMTRLTSKMKEDVKKILNSKHLFYPEMCAYHNGQRIPNCEEVDVLQGCESPVVGLCGSKENVIRSVDEVGEKDESDDDDDDDEDDDNDDGENLDGEDGRVTGQNSFRDEMNEFFADPNNSKLQKQVWIEKRMLQLGEQRVGLETEAFEMEKRRFKWQRFCDKKDRELETARLENERLMLENEHMALQLKHRNQVVDSD